MAIVVQPLPVLLLLSSGSLGKRGIAAAGRGVGSGPEAVGMGIVGIVRGSARLAKVLNRGGRLLVQGALIGKGAGADSRTTFLRDATARGAVTLLEVILSAARPASTWPSPFRAALF